MHASIKTMYITFIKLFSPYAVYRARIWYFWEKKIRQMPHPGANNLCQKYQKMPTRGSTKCCDQLSLGLTIDTKKKNWNKTRSSLITWNRFLRYSFRTFMTVLKTCPWALTIVFLFQINQYAINTLQVGGEILIWKCFSWLHFSESSTVVHKAEIWNEKPPLCNSNVKSIVLMFKNQSVDENTNSGGQSLLACSHLKL